MITLRKPENASFAGEPYIKGALFEVILSPRTTLHAPKGSTQIIQPKKTSGRRPWVRG